MPWCRQTGRWADGVHLDRGRQYVPGVQVIVLYGGRAAPFDCPVHSRTKSWQLYLLQHYGLVQALYLCVNQMNVVLCLRNASHVGRKC